MKKIIACIVALSVILGLITALDVDPALLEKDAVLVDDPSVEYDAQALYDELFDPGSIVEIAINMPRGQVADLQQDYTYYNKIKAKSTAYRIADSVTFTVNGRKYVIEDVGVRIKGAKSRSNFYNDILGIYNLFHIRLSFNETFDDMSDYKLDTRVWPNEQERKKRLKRTFATMHEMELKWNTSADNTYVRNSYVHEMFRAYGIPVQKCHLSALSLSGSKLGIYRMFEPVDSGFIRRYFPEEDWGGDLYKVKSTTGQLCTYELDNTYGVTQKQKADFYNFNLKTNKSKSKHESLLRMLETINRPGATREDFESVVDMDELTRFTAVNFAAGNMDEMRFNYNNHYIYFRKSDGKAVFIPYDCELVMGAVYAWNPLEGQAMTNVSPYFEGTLFTDIPQLNPLVQQIVFSGSEYEKLYTRDLVEIAKSKWMDYAWFKQYYEPIAAHYSDKLISKYNYMSTVGMNIDFSLEGGENFNGNMAIDEFLRKMRTNILNNAHTAPEE